MKKNSGDQPNSLSLTLLQKGDRLLSGGSCATTPTTSEAKRAAPRGLAFQSGAASQGTVSQRWIVLVLVLHVRSVGVVEEAAAAAIASVGQRDERFERGTEKGKEVL